MSPALVRAALLSASVLAALAAGCHEAAGVSATEAPLVTHLVRPADADPAITGWTATHYAWRDTSIAAPRGELLVFLSGTGGQPAWNQRIGEAGARAGYHAIALMYPNDLAVVMACAGDPAPDCMEAMRREIVEGIDLSPHVAVGPHDAIDGRLLHLLQRLAADHPGEGWEAFLAGDAIRWDRVAVGGLSQGGGHAALIAKERRVARVLMFGAPADGYGGQPAPWMSTGETPAGRWFGFAHQRDPFTSIRPNWSVLGLGAFGEVVRVEQGASPWGGTHTLTTDLRPATGSYDQAHPSVVADAATPLTSSGRPVFAPVWRYMLTATEPGARQAR